jgi:glycosyltransferase involved in cell wall biosynthesis
LERARALGVDGRLELHEGVAHHEVPRYLHQMSVLVLPSVTTPAWKEQFGHVLIEAMACGTPVVALRRGSVPEIVVEGVTGFIRDRPDELPEAVSRTGTIDPLACRTHVERHFTVDHMVNGYERIYSQVRAQTFGEAIRSPSPVTGSDPLARSRPQPSLRSPSSVARRLGKQETSPGRSA